MEDYIVIYAVVPKHIYETKLLTPEEKLIAERIIYLCKKEGYCWITNKKLSEMYNITIETASRHIKKLEKIIINCFGTDEIFINKAIGWALREYSKTNSTWVKEFINRYKNQMSNFSIKEASKYI